MTAADGSDRSEEQAATPAGPEVDLSPEARRLLALLLTLEPDMARRVRAELPRRRNPSRTTRQAGPMLDLGE